MERRGASLQYALLVGAERYSGGSYVIIRPREGAFLSLSDSGKLSLLLIPSASAQLWSWDVLEICFGAGKGGYGSLQLEAQKGWCDGACIKGKIWIHAVFIGSCMINLGIALFGCKLMQTS